MSQTTKKHAAHGFSQFRFTQNLLNNLSQFEVSPIAKLVLLELSACFNAKTQFVFPKQATLAAKIGCSERSVIRAVQELVKAGLISIEGKYTYKYKFTQKTLNLGGMVQLTQSDEKEEIEEGQNVTQEDDKMSPLPDKLSSTCTEPMNEQKKELTNVVEYKILKEYAERNGAKNVTAYINSLKKSGAAAKIIQNAIEQEKTSLYWKNQANSTVEMINQFSSYKNEAVPPTEAWKELKAKLLG